MSLGLSVLLSLVNPWVLGFVSFSIPLSGYIYHRYKRIRILYSQMYYSEGPTPREFCEQVASENGLGSIEIRKPSSTYSDSYHPGKDVLFLEEPAEKTVAALAVAAHEMGHVDQSRECSFYYLIQSLMSPTADIFSIMALPFLLAGFLFYYPLIPVGIILYLSAVFIVLSAFPVELDASRKGRNFLTQKSLMSTVDRDRVDAILRAAAFTYVASVTASLIKVIYDMLVSRGVFSERY